MRLLQRVAKLERSQIFRGRESVITRYGAALDQTSFQLAGCKYAEVAGDLATLILDTVAASFLPTLSDSELTELMTELEKLLFGDDMEALEQARAEALADLG